VEPAVRSGVALLLGLVPTVALAAANGGYFPSSWGWPALALLLVGAGAALVRDTVALGRRELAFAGGLLALAGLAALSAVWSPGTQDQVLDAQRGLVYVAAAAAFLLSVRAAEVPWLLGGVLAGAAGVCAWALLHRPGPADESQQLSEPIGYWNALGLLAVIGVLVAAGLVLTRRPLAARAAAAASLAVLVPALALTYSRGSWLALGAGALATAALRAPRRLRLAGAALAVAGAVAFLALGGLDRATSAFSSPIAGGTEGEQLSQRLTSFSGNGRADYWRVAWRQVEDEPLLGAGAGSFARYWARYRPNEFYARDAHNLYLETLGELGPVGLALLLATLAAPLAAALRGPALAAHAGGAYAAFLAHAALDWDWEVPAVTVPAVACACAAIRLGSPAERPLAPRVRALVLAAALPLALLAFASQVGNSRIARAEAALDDGDAAAAEARAEAARPWAPWSVEPERILGTLGRTPLLRAAVEREPARWDLWLLLAGAGGEDASRALAEARRLNPREDLAAPGGGSP
jgi:O-antigen ligase